MGCGVWWIQVIGGLARLRISCDDILTVQCRVGWPCTVLRVIWSRMLFAGVWQVSEVCETLSVLSIKICRREAGHWGGALLGSK